VKLLLKNGRLIDPKNNIDEKLDILAENGKVAQRGKSLKGSGCKVIDLNGRVVFPGFIDMHVHLREPGREDQETIETGTLAAAHGGFSSVVCMPNTEPPVDNEGIVELIYSQARANGVVNVFPVACVSRGRSGEDITEVGALKKAGAVALSDDGNTVMNSNLMRRALEYSSMFGIPVIDHCEDFSLSGDGVMNFSENSVRFGLKGIPSASEDIIVARDIILSEMTDAHVHLAHISTAGAVDLIRRARKKGLKVTAETAPHYFTLSDSYLKSFDTNFKMKPPLRTEEDRKAVIRGLEEGVIDAIASDHAPHVQHEKDVEFDFAPFGIIGLETSVGLTFTHLYHRKILNLTQIAERYSLNPAKILNFKDKGHLSEGADADFTVIDTEKNWTVKTDDFYSKSKNSPFVGWDLKGKPVLTIVGGKIAYNELP
jgi:dihydroorotase